jgi:hypothetical protein
MQVAQEVIVAERLGQRASRARIARATQLPAIINRAFSAIEKQLKKTVALRRHQVSAGSP